GGAWFKLLVLSLYMVAVGAAFVSLGLVVAQTRLPRTWMILALTVAWGGLNLGLIVMQGALEGDLRGGGLALWTGSPVIGVSALAGSISHPQINAEDAIAWAICWAIIYSFVALLLLRTVRGKSRDDDAVPIPRASLSHLTSNG